MDVIIVCHTEFGIVCNKQVIATKDTIGVTDGVQSLRDITDNYDAKVTYVVCPEVVGSLPFLGINSEIGLHIHPGWQKFDKEGIEFYVGDEYLGKHCKQSTDSTVLRDYSFEEQLGRIITGRDYLAEVLGVEPKSFVAGRWSINNDTVKALIEAGFTHECSAMAHHKEKHFDWSKLPRICMPYHPSERDYQVKGDLHLLIVPISQMIRGGNVNPEVARIYGVNWLKLCFEEYYRRGMPLFHICLHSPCMTDGYYVGVMDKLLGFIAKHKGVEFKFASEVGE